MAEREAFSGDRRRRLKLQALDRFAPFEEEAASLAAEFAMLPDRLPDLARKLEIESDGEPEALLERIAREIERTGVPRFLMIARHEMWRILKDREDRGRAGSRNDEDGARRTPADEHRAHRNAYTGPERRDGPEDRRAHRERRLVLRDERGERRDGEDRRRRPMGRRREDPERVSKIYLKWIREGDGQEKPD